jgi:hypothetical protein
MKSKYGQYDGKVNSTGERGMMEVKDRMEP